MSTLMGFGINQYRSYEEGEIPSLSNAKLISLARDPRNFRELILERKDELKERELADLLRRVDELMISQKYLEQTYAERGDEVFETYQPHHSRQADTSIFSHSELEVLHLTAQTFRFVKTADIIERSHGEIGWIVNEPSRSSISYQQYGFALKSL